MSIRFAFGAKVRKKEALIQAVRSLAASGGQGVQEDNDHIWISFCPMGGISMSWEHEDGLLGQWVISGECYSTPCGPGFHKAAIEFVDALGRSVLRGLTVSDVTDYYRHRDFQRMKKEHFYPWLKMLVNLCRERLASGEYGSLCLCWDMDQYQPEDIPGTVVTPMGRFGIAGMVKAVECLGIGWLADRFFIWNQPEKDAAYYRNRALNLMWEKCFFGPSDRSSQDADINRAALDDLEQAYRLDSRIPLPIEAYLLLCGLDSRTPIIPDTAQVLESLYPVGFRRGEVTHAYGVLRLTLPGNYLYEWEEQENGRGCGLWWDGTGKGPIWRVNGFRLQGKEASLEGGFDGLTDIRDLDMPNGRARWGWHKVEDGKDAYYQVFCKAVSGPSLFLMTITFFEEGQRAGVYGLLGKLKAVKEQEPETYTETYD